MKRRTCQMSLNNVITTKNDAFPSKENPWYFLGYNLYSFSTVYYILIIQFDCTNDSKILIISIWFSCSYCINIRQRPRTLYYTVTTMRFITFRYALPKVIDWRSGTRISVPYIELSTYDTFAVQGSPINIFEGPR